MNATRIAEVPTSQNVFETALWGLDELLTKQLSGTAFPFYLVGHPAPKFRRG
jgi:hypothetical protein